MSDYFGLEPVGLNTPLLAQSNFSDVLNKPQALTNLGAASSDDVLKAANPIGTIIAYYGTTAPYGYLPCSGQTVSSSTFPSLVTFLGGTTSATLPDLRGEFLRGWDNGRGVDVGRALKALQLDAFQGHWHNQTYSATYSIGSGGSSYIQTVTSGNNAGPLVDTIRNPISDGSNGTPRTSTETRPRNVSVLYCIKSYDAPVSSTAVNIAALVTEIAGRPTMPLFDSSSAMATTAFVQNSGLSSNGITTLNSPATLNTTHAGGVVLVGNITLGSTGVITLASTSTIPSGKTFTIVNTSAQGSTLQIVPPSGGFIAYSNIQLPSIVLSAGQSVILMSEGAGNAYLVVSGGLKSSNDFGSQLLLPGYQKLPSGLIIQWGQSTSSAGGYSSITFPVSFPTACTNVVMTAASTTSNGLVPMYNSVTITGALFAVSSVSGNTYGTAAVAWMAIGY